MNTWPIRCEQCGTGLGLLELPDDAPDSQVDAATSGYNCGQHEDAESLQTKENKHGKQL